MSTFRVISGDGPDPKLGLAIGRDTGTLFSMINSHQGVVLAGKNGFAGLEGMLVNTSAGKGVRFLPRGTTIEITV